MIRRLALAAALAVAAAQARAEVPRPEAVLGFRPGEDRRLADWPAIVDYFRKLAATSRRVTVEDVGPTTEGNPFLVVTLTSEANHARLEQIRRANLRLMDPRGLSDAEAETLLREGKVVVALQHGIHSTEVGGALSAMEVAYRLASADDEATRRWLDALVVVMLPSHNPDGTRLVFDWYGRTLGTPFEGATLPRLYQRYAGHDNNRDWYAFNLVESRLTLRHVYHRWHPQIVHDVHQMGPAGARLFLPPYLDPWEPSVDPALTAAANALGMQMAAQLTADGRAGVVVNGIFDAWTPARAYPHTHGAVRLLSETASARLASPFSVRPEELRPGLGYDPRRRSWNQPLPWPGGEWKLADIVATQVAASAALLDHATAQREFWLRGALGVARRACQRSGAFVVPAAQRDPLAAARLLEILELGDLELERAPQAFEAGGRVFPAGSHVVRLQQPASGFAQALLLPRAYPDPGGRPPYDVTAHTLPLLMGVEVVSVEALPPLPLERVAASIPAGRLEGEGPFLALGHGVAELRALSRLLRERVDVRWSRLDGALVVPAGARGRLQALAAELPIAARTLATRPEGPSLQAPRVGLYQSWLAPMDEGWTRLVLEQHLELPYRTLHDAEVRRGKLRAGFDAIVLPDQTLFELRDGHAPGTMPPEYTGGLGEPGFAALRAFVEEGGTLVALNAACALPLSWGLAARDVLARPERLQDAAPGPPPEVEAPGSLLRAEVAGESLLAHGLPRELPIWFENSPAFDVEAGAVLRYGGDPLLLSGYLRGGPKLAGRAALVELSQGRGRVVLFGFRPQYRAQSWGTYVAFANALYLSAAR